MVQNEGFKPWFYVTDYDLKSWFYIYSIKIKALSFDSMINYYDYLKLSSLF